MSMAAGFAAVAGKCFDESKCKPIFLRMDPSSDGID